MGFQQTLRMVQLSRAVTIVLACVSVSMMAWVMDTRYTARKTFAADMSKALPSLFANKTPARSAIGSLALFGLAISLIWDGLCMFDLCVKKHYRFDRRVCIFIDMVVAIVLLFTGALNMAFDAVLATLEVVPKSQMKVEIPAMVFLGIVCLMHLAFFCYGCKDPAASALEFEHVPLAAHSPTLPADYTPKSMRSRTTTLEGNVEDLVHIDLGKKVSVMRFPVNTIGSARTSPRSPRTPREENESKRLGFVGTPDRLSAAAPKQNQQQQQQQQQQTKRTAEPRGERQEEDPFLDQNQSTDWI